jgi:Zn-dependent protease with chaperone function
MGKTGFDAVFLLLPVYLFCPLIDPIMSATSYQYPATPVNVPASVTQPSASFRKEVTGVMGSIVFFFIVYLLLFLLSIGLVIACFYGGIAIIVAIPRLITIAAGIGLIGVGVMIFVFLIKFMFAVSKYDRSNIVEITEVDQPMLFGFIRQLTQDTQTPFPKRIYLSADVNACVFYDSSFLSMFFPVRKNLQIGLGLVNVLTVSEFKAVMAHEFGHFSQRSMKLGSFVYNVNKIIYNMLFDNRSYANFLQGWANIDGVFAFFASITAKIASGIQWILREMYGLINKSYMRLSREMEFQADAVAASVSGSDSLVTALRKVEMAGSGYEIVLQKCDAFFREKKISENIYPNHSAVLLQIASELKLPVSNGLPLIPDEFIQQTNFSRINFKDQWASHPSTNDREQKLKQLAVPAETVNDSAWILFSEAGKWQINLTRKIYETTEKPADPVILSERDFKDKLREESSLFTLPDEYKGFYDNRQVEIIEMESLDSNGTDKKFDELITDEDASVPKKIQAGRNDLEILKAIADKRIQVKSFDFDGIKYPRAEAATVASQLEEETKQSDEKLVKLDKEIIQFFLQRSGQKGLDVQQDLKNDYKNYFELRKKAEEYLKQVNAMMESLQPIFAGQSMQIEEINRMIDQLKTRYEKEFKDNLRSWITMGAFNLDQEIRIKAEQFIESRHVYFGANSFFDSELLELNEVCRESWIVIHNFVFARFKAILEKQLVVLNN